MIRKITGSLLVLSALAVIWLFPALATPRDSLPFAGQDLMEFHRAQVQKFRRSETITLWVCIPAGIVVGIGLAVFVSGFNKPELTIESQQK